MLNFFSFKMTIHGRGNKIICPADWSAHTGDAEWVQPCASVDARNVWNWVLLERGTNLFIMWTGLNEVSKTMPKFPSFDFYFLIFEPSRPKHLYVCVTGNKKKRKKKIITIIVRYFCCLNP